MTLLAFKISLLFSRLRQAANSAVARRTPRIIPNLCARNQARQFSLRPRQELSGVAKGGAAQNGAEKAHLSEAEEAPRGVERRAERHAATRFVGCAAEHATRQGGCIQPTKHRGAKRCEGDGSSDEGVSPEREARTAKRALAGRGSEAETSRRRDEHPRCHGRQVSPPSAEHTEASRGGLRRTATRRRICIRREYPPSAKHEPRSGR